MSLQLCEGAEAVRVGLILPSVPEGEDCVLSRADGRGVDYKSGEEQEAKTFSFHRVVTADDMQSLNPELLQPLTESISSGFNGALLVCGATENIGSLIDHSIIKQMLVNLFSCVSPKEEEMFISVSFLQFYPDGSPVDLLSPGRRTPKLVTHPVLGSLVEGLQEVCVWSAEEAYTQYETCRETLKVSAGSIYNRCSSLFSVTVEWKLHPEEAESEVCRSRLQLFSLAGGASRTDLRGVSPLVKVLDQIQHESTASDKLLDVLLKDALRGNSRSGLIYCIRPPGLLEDETKSALALAQRAKHLVTKPTADRWRPRATEREIRESLMELRAMMMSQGENEAHNTYRLAELTRNLHIVKNQSWEKRRESSKNVTGKTQGHQARHRSWQRESTDVIKHLQVLLKQEMEEHIREGKGNAEKVQERVARIQQLRKTLKGEALKNGAASEKSDLCQQEHASVEYSEAQERRRQLKEERGRLIQEAMEQVERDLAQEPTDGPQRELLVLTRHRPVLVLQIEALRAEAQQAERDLQSQYHRHQTELQRQREESLQVFREFCRVSEEQRKITEGRFRSVLLEAVQDAVYLSAQNQQLQADNRQLCKALGELKDTLAVQGDPKAEPSSQKE